MGPGIFHQQYPVAGDSAAVFDIAESIDGNGGICCYGITERSHFLMKRIDRIRLQTSDDTGF